MINAQFSAFTMLHCQILCRCLFGFAVFDYLEHIDIFLDDYAKFFNGSIPLSKILDRYDDENVDCVVDMPPSFLFEEFSRRWPDAKVYNSCFIANPTIMCAF